MTTSKQEVLSEERISYYRAKCKPPRAASPDTFHEYIREMEPLAFGMEEILDAYESLRRDRDRLQAERDGLWKRQTRAEEALRWYANYESWYGEIARAYFAKQSTEAVGAVGPGRQSQEHDNVPSASVAPQSSAAVDVGEREVYRLRDYWTEESRRYAANADYWRSRATQAEARCRELEEALRDIIKHQEIVGGTLAARGATFHIAQRALRAKEGGGG